MCERNILGLEENELRYIGTDKDKSFRYFYQYFSREKASINFCWEQVKALFNTFVEWYDDLQLYHYVGFLIACRPTELTKLVGLWERSEDKSHFLKSLKKEIKVEIFRPLQKVYLFNSEVKAKTACKPMLLFHNIQTVINRNAKEQNDQIGQEGTFYKFPFHLFKKENWDVEHINSSTDNEEGDTNTQGEWLLNYYLSVSDEMKELISLYFNTKADDEKKRLYQKIKRNLPKQNSWPQEDKNKIWNYTLLDRSTNRSYGNAIFAAKRRIIIGKDKGVLLPIPKLSRDKKLNCGEEKEADSAFVPPCTRNVFMKYYSPTIGDNNYWTRETDAQGYLSDIIACLEQLNK